MISNAVLVFGANGGLGRQVVNDIKSNYQVIAIDKEIDESSEYLTFTCDVTNSSDIDRLYDNIKDKVDSIYAIINLIGIYKMNSVVEGDIEELKKVIDVNFYGIYRINQKFIPLLTKNSRIINCTSELASFSAIPFNGFYTLSKVILDNYSDTLRRELNYLDIKVVKIQAGSFKTKLLNNASNEYSSYYNDTKYYQKQITKLKKMMDNELSKSHNPKIFSKVINKILKKKNPKLCYSVKKSIKLRLLSILPEKLQDKIYLWYVK